MQRKFSLLSNTVANLSGVGFPLIVAILTIPPYLRIIGQSRFGIITLIWLLFGYFGLFDLGLSRATANHLARQENAGPIRQNEILWTALIVNALLGVVGATVLYFIGKIATPMLHAIPGNMQNEVAGALPWVACLLPLSTTSSVFAGALEAHERFVALNIIQITAATLAQVVPLAAAFFIGPTIINLVIATALVRLCSVIPLGWLALRQCSASRPHLGKSQLLELFRYGGWVTVTNTVGPILTSIDQVMIGAFLGVSALTKYSIPFGIASKVLIVPGAVTRALFPTVVRLSPSDARARTELVAVTVAHIMAAICAPAIVAVSVALNIWLGAQFSADASEISRIILCGVWINGIAFVPAMLLQSQGRPSIPAKLHVAELLPFLLILWIGIHYFGLLGAALAWAIRVTVDAILLLIAVGFSASATGKVLRSACFIIASLGLAKLCSASVIGSIASAGGILVLVLIYSIRVDPIFRKLSAKLRILPQA